MRYICTYHTSVIMTCKLRRDDAATTSTRADKGLGSPLPFVYFIGTSHKNRLRGICFASHRSALVSRPGGPPTSCNICALSAIYGVAESIAKPRAASVSLSPLIRTQRERERERERDGFVLKHPGMHAPCTVHYADKSMRTKHVTCTPFYRTSFLGSFRA
jgi:hypothetical protein